MAYPVGEHFRLFKNLGELQECKTEASKSVSARIEITLPAVMLCYEMAGTSLHRFYVMTPKITPPEFLYVMANPIKYTQKSGFQVSYLDTQWIP